MRPSGAIIYDHNRATDREILMARFSEEDVLAEKFVSKDSREKLLVSKPTAPLSPKAPK
jgi:hypothetical protein